jgi:hypothetical protein
MFNIFSHQGSENENDTEIPCNPSRNSYHQANKQQQIIARMQGNRKPFLYNVQWDYKLVQ